jgi:ABC-type multidrug transport system fused ATPase/permease subunit
MNVTLTIQFGCSALLYSRCDSGMVYGNDPLLLPLPFSFSSSLEPLAMSVIEVKGLNYTHLNGTAALHNVDLDLPAGSRTLLIGGNGVGKSTLLQILGEGNPTFSWALF